MARTSDGPRSAVSPKYRKNPEKEEPVAAHSDALADEALAPEDSFILATTGVVDWIVQNKVVIGAVIGATFLIAIGVSVYSGMQATKEGEVATEVFKATRKMPTVTGKVSPEDAAKFREAAAALQQVASEESGVRAAHVAELYAGYSLLQAGDSSEAVATFQAAAGKVSEPVLESFALSGLASAHSQAGNDQAAVDTLRKMTTDLKGVWRESAYVDLGLSLEGMGQAAEAATAYEKLLTDHPFSAFAETAKERLAEVKPDSSLLSAPEKAEAPAGE